MTKLELDPTHLRTQSNSYIYDIQTLKNRSFNRSEDLRQSFGHNVAIQSQAKKIMGKQAMMNKDKAIRSHQDSYMDFLELEKNLYMQKNIDEIER